jgi:uncharacterized protein (DUF58 family)
VAWWWHKQSLINVYYKRLFHFTRGFPEERIELQVEVENRKLLPISWLRIQDDWDRAVGPEDEEVLAPSHIKDRGYLTNIFSLRWYEKARRSYTLLLRNRGIYSVGPARLDSGDLFGIFEKTKVVDPNQYLIVFPTLNFLRKIHLVKENLVADYSRTQIVQWVCESIDQRTVFARCIGLQQLVQVNCR